jgi:polyisoprenyl-teichoic acid--peptidoglycan teichoic acid transferase
MLGAAALAAIVLLGGGAVVVASVLRDRYEVPTADLFGTPTPPASQPATPSPGPPPGADITGPLNLLIVGVDTREDDPSWEPHADAVTILHVPRGLKTGYLFSLPRDLLVDVPAFPKSRYRGGRTKLTEAMSNGSRRGDAKPDVTQGFQLFAQAVSRYTGIKRFDAGAVLTFTGFRKLVDALGGVDIYVDQRTPSQHLRPDGRGRSAGGGPAGYGGPQMVYEVGMRHLVGWQALDFSRQRYLPGGDYTRQRHHQQLVRAVLAKALNLDVARNPIAFDRVLRALGKTLTFDGRGRPARDFAYALGGMRPEALTLVTLPGSGVGRGSGYRGEQLTAQSRKFISELIAGRADAYLRAHPALVIRK